MLERRLAIILHNIFGANVGFASPCPARDPPMEMYVDCMQFLSNIPTLIAKIHRRMGNNLTL